VLDHLDKGNRVAAGADSGEPLEQEGLESVLGERAALGVTIGRRG
jgi:hypothetical protein